MSFRGSAILSLLYVVLLGMAAHGAAADREQTGLRLHPDNPHYFLFRGKPALLITSGEHYGAVLNLDFDAKPYLDRLQADGLNLTRLFTGVYCESPESFGIEHNTLAPSKEKLICPYARSEQPGYANGGNKFDLSKWDETYFTRLKSFVAEASKRGIVVELSIFCPFYEDPQWALSPLNAKNNVNGIGGLPPTDVYTLKNKPMVELHERLVRKLCEELKDADNIYFEICNEPYFGGVTIEWQHHIAEVIVDAENGLPADKRHLIAQNIANESKKIEKPHSAVSIFNFHYAKTTAVSENYALNKPLGDDETGFKGTSDLPYRVEAWEFVLGGGSIISSLDYSFTADHEEGSSKHTKSPGGGGPALRKQLRILKEFMEGFDLARLRPDNTVIEGGIPAGGAAHAMSIPGNAYAIYIRGGTKAALSLDLPKAKYRATWISTITGDAVMREFDHPGGNARLESPKYADDIALHVLRIKS